MTRSKAQLVNKKTKRIKRDNASKREWLKVIGPDTIKEKFVAETTIKKEGKGKNRFQGINNRVFKVNLADLVREANIDHMNIRLRVSGTDNDILKTEFDGFYTTRDKYSSIIRKWHSFLEAWVDLKTSDDIFVRLFIVCATKRTRGQKKKFSYLKSSQRRSINRIIREILIKIGSKSTIKQLMDKIISGYFVDNIQQLTSKIYPIQNILIHKIKILR